MHAPKMAADKLYVQYIKNVKNILTDMGDGGDSNTTMKYIQNTKTNRTHSRTGKKQLCSNHLRISTGKHTF